MSICLICEKHQRLNDNIYEDEDWIVNIGPLSSQVLGYLYIEPKRHVENWSDFTVKELSKVGPLIKRIEEILIKELLVERVYIVTISEAVRHIHFHIIPRLNESTSKGLELIKQATSQNARSEEISEAEYQKFGESLKLHFNQYKI